MASRTRFPLAIVILLLVASRAPAGVPDLELSEATTLAPPATTVFSLPDGQGNRLTEASTPLGVVVDATVRLVLVDEFGVPIPSFPAEDLWLEPTGSWWGVCTCPHGTAADAPTDASGRTQWTQPLRVGGCTMGFDMLVMVAGAALIQPGLSLFWNSADANGDGVVNLADVTPFATAFLQGYHPCFDFVRGGGTNLADVTLLARGLGASCR